MEMLQTAEHVSEGNKSSSLLYKQIQSLLCRQEGTAALPQQQGSPGPHAASNTQEPVEEKAVIPWKWKMQGATDTDLMIPNHQVQNGERQFLKS